jgi:hypothetical protein
VTWLEKLEKASTSGGVTLNGVECYQLWVFIASLIKKAAEGKKP